MQLYNFEKMLNTNKLPMRQYRQLEDLLVYKKSILQLRNNFYNGFCSIITYVKKSNNQVKKYQLQLQTYYYNREKKQFIVIAKDINSNNEFAKTFILDNILNVQRSVRTYDNKLFKIN